MSQPHRRRRRRRARLGQTGCQQCGLIGGLDVSWVPLRVVHYEHKIEHVGALLRRVAPSLQHHTYKYVVHGKDVALFRALAHSHRGTCAHSRARVCGGCVWRHGRAQERGNHTGTALGVFRTRSVRKRERNIAGERAHDPAPRQEGSQPPKEMCIRCGAAWLCGTVAFGVVLHGCAEELQVGLALRGPRLCRRATGRTCSEGAKAVQKSSGRSGTNQRAHARYTRPPSVGTSFNTCTAFHK